MQFSSKTAKVQAFVAFAALTFLPLGDENVRHPSPSAVSARLHELPVAGRFLVDRRDGEGWLIHGFVPERRSEPPRHVVTVEEVLSSGESASVPVIAVLHAPAAGTGELEMVTFGPRVAEIAPSSIPGDAPVIGWAPLVEARQTEASVLETPINAVGWIPLIDHQGKLLGVLLATSSRNAPGIRKPSFRLGSSLPI